MRKALEIKAAETALERGDYSLCLKLLNTLLEKDSLRDQELAQIRMLIVTAHMGQGEEQKAIDSCRLLVKDKDPNIRHEAKQLLSILEAPSLPRPEDWSIQIPSLGLNPSNKTGLELTSQSRKKKEKPKLPPTGETKNLRPGFSVIVLIVIIVLTFLLSGCVQITSNFELKGPDKIKTIWGVESNSDQLLPWQIQFEKSLENLSPEIKSKRTLKTQEFVSRSQTSEELNKTLQSIATSASISSGFNVRNPQIILKKQNWFIGVRQDILLTFDLSNIPKIPGLNISINITPLFKSRDLQSSPLKATFYGNQLSWQLLQGRMNQLHFVAWQWSRLTIGVILIFIFTVFISLLQSLRLRMGFGFPELPP